MANSDRMEVSFRMSADDLAFLASMMEFVKGGIDDELEHRREHWRVMFDDKLDEIYVDDQPADEAGPRLSAFHPES